MNSEDKTVFSLVLVLLLVLFVGVYILIRTETVEECVKNCQNIFSKPVFTKSQCMQRCWERGKEEP